MKMLSSNNRYYIVAAMIIVIISAIILIANRSGFDCVNTMYYLLFTGVSYALLLNGFRSGALYFELFIGIFFWLGFWLKLTLVEVFSSLKYTDPTGEYYGGESQLGHALLVSSVGMSGFVAASYIMRMGFVTRHIKNSKFNLSNLEHLYNSNRIKIIASFAIVSTILFAMNLTFGIYQKGLPANTNLPFGMNRIVTWLLIFGMSSIASYFIYFDKKAGKIGVLSTIIYTYDAMLSSLSQLSRGFILNTSSMIMVHFLHWKTAAAAFKLKIKQMVLFGGTFLILVSITIISVNILRYSKHNLRTDGEYFSHSVNAKDLISTTKVLLIGRWVGIEGVLAVASYPDLGWSLWSKAVKEKYQDTGTSFYDKTIVANDSPYVDKDTSRHHFITLPGVIAFLYYPGSMFFLFLSCLILGLICSFVEKAALFWSSDNIFLCALIGQVLAYRLSNFGYVPMQTYLLFGSVIATIFLALLVEKMLATIRTLKCSRNSSDA